MATKFSEKLQKLQRMSPHELLYRLHERWRIECDRLRLSFGPSREMGPELGASIKKYLQGTPSQRFYASATESRRQSVVRFMKERFPDWIHAISDDAERLCRHEFQLLAYHKTTL